MAGQEPTPETRPKSGIRVSSLPIDIQATAKELDMNNNGALGSVEIKQAIGDLHESKKENKNLKTLIVAFVILVLLLVAAIFGASIAAARLAQEVSVDQDTGYAYVKGTNDIMKTDQAIEFKDMVFAELSNEELLGLREIVLADGDLRFVVKGHSRGGTGTVRILVEGGSILFDVDGILEATGEAKILLTDTFGPEAFVEGSGDQRRLASQCSVGGGGGNWWY